MNHNVKSPEAFETPILLETRPYESMERLELYLIIHRLKGELVKALDRLAKLTEKDTAN